MSGPESAIAELAALIERVSGNVVPAEHYPFLSETARRRAAHVRLAGAPEYVRALADGDLPGEWSRLLAHVTVKESFLFRHPQQLAALATTVVPRLTAARAARRTFAVWSAGCARGEEPATLAIVLAECRELAGWDWRILATDVDEEALAAAAAGRFGERAVSAVPPELLARHLARTGGAWELSPELAHRIRYRALNLVEEPLELPPGSFDLVFMRNVLIYFRPETQRRVAAAVAGALAPDGYLFLGPAETLWQLSGGLDAVDLVECFCYRHAEPGARGRESGARDAGAPPASPAPAPPAAGPGRAIGALRPPPGLIGTRERITLAARHLAEGRREAAAGLVDQALLADPSDAGVHALEGLAHALSARWQTAVASYRAALFLDARLFQVRLLLADALRRLGHGQRADLECREVLATLAAGQAREIEALAPLGLPDRAEAERRCREALRGGAGRAPLPAP